MNANSSEDEDSEISLSPQDLRNRKLQLIYIIKNLQEVHKTNTQYLTYILEAQNHLLKDNVVEAANALQGILYDDNMDDTTKKLHNYIIYEAKKVLYNDIM